MLHERVYTVCTFLKAKFVTKQSTMNKVFKSLISHATFVAIKGKHVEVCPISCLPSVGVLGMAICSTKMCCVRNKNNCMH